MRFKLITLFVLTLLSSAVFFANPTQAFHSQSGQQSAQTQAKQTQEEFIVEVRKNFDEEKFDVLDKTAFEARESKERFPGAEWKLYLFYQTLAWPNAGAKATDQAWKVHLKRLQTWVDKVSDSMTARVALAGAWVEYAKKARTSATDWTAMEGQIGGKEYQERLKQAKKALVFDPMNLTTRFLTKVKREYSTKTSSQLRSYCPQWYVVRLAIEQGSPWEWKRYDNIFGEAVALEPTYYYLYQTKAADLLPSLDHRTTKGQWEAFADNSARTIGGKEGEITYYMVVAYMRRYFDSSLSQGNFFRDNLISGTRLLEGYKQIEATYGVNNTRLNEMALMASMAKQFAMAKVFFDQIGENWEPAIWQHKSEFDGYRTLTLAKAPAGTGVLGGPYGSGTAKPQSNMQANPASLANLRATISSRVSSYSKSQDVIVEALIENTAPTATELSIPALTLVIMDTRKRGQEITLMPQPDDSHPLDKELNPGQSARLAYRINFSLAAGDYKIKMKSLTTNELLIRIGGTPAPRKR